MRYCTTGGLPYLAHIQEISQEEEEVEVREEINKGPPTPACLLQLPLHRVLARQLG